MDVMKNFTLLGTTLLVASSVLSFNAIAEIYTWTDANGKVHFSDQPIDDEKVTTITPQKDINIANTVNQNTQWQQDYDKSKQAKVEHDQKQAQLVQKKKGYCDELKRQLAIYQQGGRLYIMSVGGERSYQSDEQVKAKQNKFTTLIKKNCR
jgi:hypothetical protein